MSWKNIETTRNYNSLYDICDIEIDLPAQALMFLMNFRSLHLCLRYQLLTQIRYVQQNIHVTEKNVKEKQYYISFYGKKWARRQGDLSL